MSYIGINLTSGPVLQTGILVADTINYPGGSSDSLSELTKVTISGAQVTVSAAFEIQSTTGSLLIPRVTTTQKNNMIATNGMMVYDTTMSAFNFYQGGMWLPFGTTEVTSVTGTANQITASPSTGNVILSFPSVLHTVNGNILDDGSGNASFATLTATGFMASTAVLTNGSGQLITGTINLASSSYVSGLLGGVNGGTGTNNGSSTISIQGNVQFSGAFHFNATLTNTTSVVFPTSGTLATTAGTVASITGTANQITASAATGPVTLSFPSVLHTVNGNVLDDGSGNATFNNLTVSNLSASEAVVTNGSMQLSSINYGSSSVANSLVQRDVSGNFTANTITASLTGHASLDIPLAGGTITGAIINYTASPSNSLELVPKTYVDSIAAGIIVLTPARVTTTGSNLNATYNNGSSGVGATLTNAGTQVALSIDGVSLSVNDRVLIKDQTSQFQNGIYSVTNIGSGSTNWVITRTTDFNSSSNVKEGSFILITAGSTNNGSQWVETGTGPFTIGTTAIVFTLFNTAANITGGTGISVTGNVVSLITPVTLANGGTNASLTASNGGIVYSTASALAILSGTPTANLPLLSGSSTTPSWGSFALSLGGALTTAGAHTLSGAFASTFTFTGSTSVTFPTSGTLVTTANTVASITGTANQITASAATGAVTLSFPSVLHSANNVLDDGSGNATFSSVTASNLSASVPVLSNGTKELVSGTINLASSSFVSGILPSANGGTGVNNGTSTITVGGNTAFSGAFTFTGTLTANTSVTFPTSGTLATTAGTVSSITGTANQINASAATGAVTLSFPSVLHSSNNVLDDGSGNATFKSTGGAEIPITLDTNSASFPTYLYFKNNGSQKVGMKWDSSNGFQGFDNSAGLIWFQGSTSIASLNSNKNTLDDGSGNMTLTLADVSNPTGLNITRSGVTTTARTRIQFSPPGLALWEIGTDSSLSGTSDWYLHSSAFGFVLHATNAGLLQSANNTLDDGSGNFQGNTDNTYLTQDGGFARVGFVKKSGSIAKIGSTSTNDIAFVNYGTLTNFTSSGISANTPTTLFTVGHGGIITTSHNTLDDGSGGCSIATSGSAAINIGTGSYTGTVTIGNSSGSSTSTVNINSGLTISDSNFPVALTVNSNVANACTIKMNVSSSTQYSFSCSNTTGSFSINNSSGAAILQQSSSSALSLLSAFNTLDDGSGNVTINSTPATNAFNAVIKGYGSQTFFGLSNYTSLVLKNNNVTSSFGANTLLAISWDSTNGVRIFDFYNNHSWLTQGGTTPGKVQTSNNTLDNGSGVMISGKAFPWGITTVSTPSTGSQTITAAQILGGIVLSPVQSSAYTWTTDTGTNLYTAMGSPAVGTTVQCLWSNDNNAGGAVMTIAFGSGVSGNLRGDTLSNNQSMVIYFRCTGTNTFTCYS